MVLTEIESKKLLSRAGIEVNDTRLAASRDEAIEISKSLGFPVVLKVASSDIVHKSDAGAVKLGLETPVQVGKAWDEIMNIARVKYPKATVDGVSVQKMAPRGVEVIIGMSKDEQFGPVLMFGLGGVWVEILKDVSFKIVPLTDQDATDMIREIKGYALLKGYRGQKPVDIPHLERLLVQVSQFAEKNPNIKELDLNPVLAYPDGALAVDARIVLEDGAAT